MLRTVAVVALKGGSGKTTIAAHLALAAHLRGVDTLVVDTDPQRSVSEVLSAREAEGPSVAEATGAQLLAAQIGAVGLRKQLMVIDTAAGALEDVSEAIVLADLAVMVVRPTLLDIAALARNTEQGAELYAASRLAIDPDDPREQRYLDELAQALNLPLGFKAELDRQLVAAG